jgi:peptidyl-dipeptidase A
MLRKYLTIVLSFFLIGCSGRMQEERAAQAFIDSLANVVAPLYIEAARTYWDATASGNDSLYEKYAQLDLALTKVYANPNDFARLKKMREGQIKDAKLARQIEINYLNFLANQTDTALLKKITDLQTSVEARFNKFRGQIDGKPVTGNDIIEILSNSNNLKLRRKAWEAAKQVAPQVAADIVELARLRNQAARSMGFNNYYEMSLITSEQDPAEIQRIFDELEKETQEPFIKAKTYMDSVLAQRFGIKPAELRPWHYADPFFQEAPVVTEINLDRYYEKTDVVGLAHRFYNGIGLNVDSILAHSDLYEREGKYPHAYCTDIDRSGDVRIMVNVRNNANWMGTTLHELGHAVYSYNVDRNLPFFLREEAHTFTTEAIAIFFEQLACNPTWMQQMLGLSEAEKAALIATTKLTSQLQKLIFARWSLVMLHFEKALYTDPEQDLNKLWWDLVEKYQMVKRPEGRNAPDWAAKIHIAAYPVYYHNYQLGHLLAAQLLHAFMQESKVASLDEVVFVNNTLLGQYLKQNVFAPGKLYRWDEMIVRATGEKLTAHYFVEQL